ncbi:alpha-ketoglutarate-dependent dioxygenase AlkB [Bernardetia sp. Wsw4-3y2]|uniref:alpha-ketoglutarate-dependent dioxygenase AlkB family protein n=1 Tax=Bernardetia sp. Wsw4-3y2 TaxID=3127471 RepID=UPI0030D47AB3
MDLFNQSSFQNKLPFILPQKEGYSYFFDEDKKAFIISIPNGKLIFVPNFFDENLSSELMNYFLENDNNLNWNKIDWREFEKEKLSEINFATINWTHNQIKIFGKLLFEPRFSAWYGDEEAAYSYSGLKLKPNPWNEKLLFIKEKIEKLIEEVEKIQNKESLKFNSVLLNWYRDGQDSMGWHSDNEKELGQNPVIASVNFGVPRRFLLRQINNKSHKLEFYLTNGSLLIMAGQIQHFWQHAVPKESKINEHRINLTFRKIKM